VLLNEKVMILDGFQVGCSEVAWVMKIITIVVYVEFYKKEEESNGVGQKLSSEPNPSN
jgi:hypothetical protein